MEAPAGLRSHSRIPGGNAITLTWFCDSGQRSAGYLNSSRRSSLPHSGESCASFCRGSLTAGLFIILRSLTCRKSNPAGIKAYRYERGFLHQKVILVDDDFAVVGSANLDNRSFRLNFESIVAVRDERFAGEVAAVLEADFAHSSLTSAAVLADKSFYFRLKTRVSQLLAPIQ